MGILTSTTRRVTLRQEFLSRITEKLFKPSAVKTKIKQKWNK